MRFLRLNYNDKDLNASIVTYVCNTRQLTALSLNILQRTRSHSKRHLRTVLQ